MSTIKELRKLIKGLTMCQRSRFSTVKYLIT